MVKWGGKKPDAGDAPGAAAQEAQAEARAEAGTNTFYLATSLVFDRVDNDPPASPQPSPPAAVQPAAVPSRVTKNNIVSSLSFVQPEPEPVPVSEPAITPPAVVEPAESGSKNTNTPPGAEAPPASAKRKKASSPSACTTRQWLLIVACATVSLLCLALAVVVGVFSWIWKNPAYPAAMVAPSRWPTVSTSPADLAAYGQGAHVPQDVQNVLSNFDKFTRDPGAADAETSSVFGGEASDTAAAAQCQQAGGVWVVDSCCMTPQACAVLLADYSDSLKPILDTMG